MQLFQATMNDTLKLPFYSGRVPAGFPSPAESYLEKKLDLNEYLINHPAATYFVRVSGNSMINAGINNGDLLIVDKAERPTHGKIVIAVIAGEMTVKRLIRKNGKLYLQPENPEFKTIEVKDADELTIWGVVTNVIHKTV